MAAERAAVDEAPPRERSRTVDAVRGLAVVGFLAVNNAGAAAEAYPQLGHAAWHGFTAADLVFPLFLVVMGAGIALGGKERLTVVRIVRRAVILFALGLVINLVPVFDFGQVRILGVLQRIAIVYLLAGLAVRFLPVWAQAALVAALLAVHTWLLTWGGAPSLPGIKVRTGGLADTAAWIDVRILGERHGYFGTFPDPEGLLGMLAATVSVLLGVWAGLALRSRWRWTSLGGTTAAGCGLLLGAAELAKVVPINKQLWTASFTLLSAGISCLILVAAELLARAPVGRQLLWPPMVLGRNALLVYAGAEAARHWLREIRPEPEVTALARLQDWFTHAFGGEPAGSLALMAALVALSWLTAAALHARHWYLRL